jgi:hypothetical protein
VLVCGCELVCWCVDVKWCVDMKLCVMVWMRNGVMVCGCELVWWSDGRVSADGGDGVFGCKGEGVTRRCNTQACIFIIV